MTEGAFPVLGALFVAFVVLPLGALLAKAGLFWIEQSGPRRVLHALDLRLALLVGSSALPLAWFISAGVHQAEEGSGSSLACLFEHDVPSSCLEPALFVLLLSGGALLALGRLLARAGSVPVAHSERARVLRRRLARLFRERPGLSHLGARVVITDSPLAIAARGYVRPYVVLGTAFAEQLSDDALASALAHEAEHLARRDPLRYLLLELALAVNPLGRTLLGPEAARWRAAREAHCDREAVLSGARPLALAEALVRAARPQPIEAVALGAPRASVLALRVKMLLAYAERAPERCCRARARTTLLPLVVLALVLVLPHQFGAGVLDRLHTGSERALAALSR